MKRRPTTFLNPKYPLKGFRVLKTEVVESQFIKLHRDNYGERNER